MASYHSILQHSNSQFESPAKVFAKLKSKVTLQREAVGATEGIFTGRDPSCNVREKHGALFMSPKRRTERPGELKENPRIGSYRDEAEALTLSPISSPQKSLGYSYSDFSCKPVVEIPHMTDIGHVLQSRNPHTPTKRAYLESTAVFHPLVNGFSGTSRTPVRKHPVDKSCNRWVSEEECAPLENLISPGKMINLMRKRKWGQQEMNKVSSSTKEVCNKVISQPKERKCSAAFSEYDTHNNICTEDLGTVRGCSFPAERSEVNQTLHEPMFVQPRPIVQKRERLFAALKHIFLLHLYWGPTDLMFMALLF